jgi:pyrroline-5-carboxylate reductase
MRHSAPHILLVGCGKMGAALAAAWVRSGEIGLTIVEPHDIPIILERRDISHVTNLTDLAHHEVPFDAVVLAVKPQMMDDVLRDLHPLLEPTTLVISIAAGQSVSRLRLGLRGHTVIVRAMPNLPAAVGRGMTALYSATPLLAGDMTLAQNLLAAVGHIIWIEHETDMDAITAVSGSGPAYVFLLTEAMAQAGQKLGLSPAVAMHLARQTVIGSAALLQAEPDLDAQTLRENVTSPGGTTEAALGVLMGTPGLAGLFEQALAAAYNRSRELNR